LWGKAHANVFGKRDGQEIESVTTNRSAGSTAAWISVGRDRIDFLTVSLAKYVNQLTLHPCSHHTHPLLSPLDV
jgi:hypothetical protein